MKPIRVLVACEFSGVVRRAFDSDDRFDAYSCDILESEDNSPKHFAGDVTGILGLDWDLMIAHPPCTYLSNSGVRWLHEKPGRWKLMEDASLFFKSLLGCDIQHKAIENPVMHKYAVEIIGRRQDFSIQPWQFGHGETKRTCFWTEELPDLEPTNIVEGRENRIHRMPPSKTRWKERSRTYEGVANAMVSQWGEYVYQKKLAHAETLP